MSDLILALWSEGSHIGLKQRAARQYDSPADK